MFNISCGFFLLLFLFSSNILLAQDLQTIIDSAQNQEAFWSVTVRDGEGNILEKLNADKLIIPASNQKLFTTAAVLDGLGSDFRYTTNIYGEGKLEDGIWKGRWFVKGSGDPSISGIMYNNNQDYVFKSLLNQLNDRGIVEFNGEIQSDISLFDEEIYPKGWDWDDLSFYYGVEIAPLSFNNNAIDLIVNADGKIGEKPSISWLPKYSPFIEFYNEQIITTKEKEYDEYYRRELGTNKIFLKSRLPQGYIEEESLSINDANHFFVGAFENYLIQQNIRTHTQEVFAFQLTPVDYSGYEILASHTSEPLSKLVEWTNKESDNFYTEMLLKTLAAEKAGIPGTFENGIKEVRNFLGRMEIDTTYVIMKDGSGMASGNFTKTAILSEFLVKMQSHPEFSSFYHSMSIAGIDGTIAHRMKGTPLYNNFKGKSGYVGGVRTLSGYFTTASGEKLIVSLAANNFIGKVRPIDAIHEQILEYLYAKY